MSELYHHGILGQKWGVRRYQNKDGSLTELGKNVRKAKKYKSPDRIDNENSKNVIPIKAKDIYISDLDPLLKERGQKWFNEQTKTEWDTKWLKSKEGLVAIDRGRDCIAGYILINTTSKKYPNLITPLEVMPEYRRQGLGKKLLDETNKRYDETSLGVWMDNKAAINLYEKSGYKRVEDNFYKEKGDVYAGWHYMKKENKR